MTVMYKCKIEVLPNLWHHNVLVDDAEMRVIENSEVPMSEEEVIEGIKSQVLVTTDGWVVKCT